MISPPSPPTQKTTAGNSTSKSFSKKVYTFVDRVRCTLNPKLKQQRREERRARITAILEYNAAIQARADFYNGDLVVQRRGGHGPCQTKQPSSELYSTDNLTSNNVERRLGIAI
mmetsp:Transcript_17972/g.41562  ORF Transcript_17972/g.41562 Transcript_17972/m.41562 type:complete len:114 (-) Transcript_17972:39-380(-)